MLLTTLLFTKLLFSVEAADKSTQVCRDDGTCVDKSSLVKCGSSYYCKKGQACCSHQRCMPAGAKCCNILYYCDRGRTCCGTRYCCEAGYFCDNEKCVLDENSQSSTKKPLTTPPSARYPARKTTKWFNGYTSRKSYNSYGKSSAIQFRFWHSVIIAAAVVTVAIITATVICNRRKSRSNAPGQSGRSGMVPSAPPQIYGAGAGADEMVLRAPVQTNGQSPRENMHTMAPNAGVPIHTNGHPPTRNVAFAVIKTGVPVQTNGKPTKQKNKKVPHLHAMSL